MRTTFLLQVFKHYFEELEEESLRDNFVVVVGCMIFGFLNSLSNFGVNIFFLLSSTSFLMKS